MQNLVAPKLGQYKAKPSLNNGTGGDMSVRFWGVRGQISAPGTDTIRYGGNTSCVEMRVGRKRLIFDGGSGLRVLGNHWLKEMPIEAHIFFSHSHWDSIQGFPFFTPAFIPGNCFHLYGAAAPDGASIEQCLGQQMIPPNFPVPLQVMQSDLKFHGLRSGHTVTLDDVTVEAVLLNDSHQAMGYRVNWQGYAVVYATTHSHGWGGIDENLRYLSRQADLLILNTPFPLKEDDLLNYSPLIWQDDRWQTGIVTAKVAGVKRIVMSRYHPDYNDDYLDRLQNQLQSFYPNHLLAREGMVLPVCSRV